MKARVVIILILLIFLILAAYYVSRDRSVPLPYQSNSNTMSSTTSLSVTSPAFADNTMIPSHYSCDGANTSPPLSVSGVLPQAVSLVLILEDPDAPSGTFDHWIKWNIPASTTMIEEGKEPEGMAGKNGRGQLGYTGPCPPNGTHHYYFKIYALDTMLSLPEGTTKPDLLKAIEGHIIQDGELVGLYTRSNE